ncbi:MAG: replication-associated recombination protein A [Candidatus Gastranaerophilales bacterium]|nr:replication-associated recombination protein A [Candidatus Gastranaerophilales bacterium]
MDLFDELKNTNKQVPLAEILRPKTLDEYLGQDAVISKNSALFGLLSSGRLFSVLFWGPPGCGKTTLARLLADKVNADFVELSAVTSGVKDIKETVARANENLLKGKKTILFLDEIHRYSKTQQDALLPHVENGTFYLMGSTTENPSFQVIPALLSRVRVMRLSALDDEYIKSIIAKGLHYLKDNYSDAKIKRELPDMIVNFARGDARAALNLLEDLFFASEIKDGVRILTNEKLAELAQTSLIKYSQDDHYDMASAFQKSLRGSDKNAAIYWLAKMITAGEDPRFIARRLIVCAAEDVGNADSNALTVAVNAYRAAELLGMPEARIPLAQAVEYVACAPKSNRAICAIDEAISDINNGKNYPPPMHLRDAHYKDAKKYGFGKDYVYTHDFPDEEQQFMPDEMADKKYFKD